MPIKIRIELTEDFENLSIYDHIGGNRKLFPNQDEALGPFIVATDGSTSRVGRVLFRYGDEEDPKQRLFDVREGWNELPPHKSFTDFAKFVVERGWPEKK